MATGRHLGEPHGELLLLAGWSRLQQTTAQASRTNPNQHPKPGSTAL
jgi:hypothetical protein